MLRRRPRAQPRALRDLKSARDFDELRAAAETARRKLGRAIHAVLKVAQESAAVAVSVRGSEQLQRQRQGELESALDVRHLYAEFRSTLRRPVSESSEAVLTALRYAASSVTPSAPCSKP